MKKMKKVLALMMVISMIIASFTTVNANEVENVSNDVKVVELLKLLQGDKKGLTEDYLNKKATRFKVAILSLRLKGLYDRAIDYRSHDNFSDADTISWNQGRNILAYIKANPQSGWSGAGDNTFNPNEQITAKAFYKVLLQLLGYEQGNDFTWNDVFKFAKEKGLFKIANVKEVTNEHIAIGTVEALQAKNKEGKTLINVLVEDEHIIGEEEANKTGIYIASDLKLEEAKAIDAQTLVLEFNKVVGLNIQDVKVIDSENQDISISSIKLADANKTAILTVPELQLDNEYIVKYRDSDITVIPKVKIDETKPIIENARAITSRKVEVIMSTNNINKDTLVASNFNIDNNCDVIDLEIDYVSMKNRKTKTVVILHVNRLKVGTPFTITSSNIESYKGNIANLRSSKYVFAGVSIDVSAPKIKSALSEGGYLVKIYFDEDKTLGESSARNIKNYEITPELNIKSIKIDKNVEGTARKNDSLSEEKNVVTLTTDNHTPGVTYTLKVKNITDGTYTMEEDTATFIGEEKAKNQVVTRVRTMSDKIVLVYYKYEANDTAIDINNYRVDKGARVANALFVEDKEGKIDRKRVMLIISDLKEDADYMLTIHSDVQDILGQKLKELEQFPFRGMGKITYVAGEVIDQRKIRITFLQPIKSKDVATKIWGKAYSEYGSIDVLSVGKRGDEETVTLTFDGALESDTEYTIKITNLKKVFVDTMESSTEITIRTPKGEQ